MKLSNENTTIVMLHFAGGNYYSYHFIKNYLEGFKLIIPELPGRGRRIKEPLITSLEDAVRDIYTQIMMHHLGKRLIIYGHSMGAITGLKLTAKLEEQGIFPHSLIVSGSCGPLNFSETKNYLLPTKDLKNLLKKMGGVPQEVLDDKELFDFFQPAIRADFELLERDKIQLDEKILTPIHAVMGDEDDFVHHIDNWEEFTSSDFSSEIWPGGHFFIHEHPLRLAKMLKNASEQYSHVSDLSIE